jgi:hypothetical protein
MSRSILRTAAALAAVAALAAAPGAQARPASEGPQLNYAQLKAIHGHVPPEPLGYHTAAPVERAPVQSTSPGGGSSPVPWIAGGVALLLFAGVGLVRFTGVRPARRRQPAA